jgi:sugar/nucleoside kinase (ribokinase family)
VSSSESRPTAAERRPVLCLGEALVDLICERPIEDLADADAFVPHFGGAVANVALLAARAGAPVALAGGAGDDAWGRWLRDQLAEAGVAVDRFDLVAGLATPLSLVTVNHAGEATYSIYGDTIGTVVTALGDRIAEAVRSASALFISSNTLVNADERAVTMRAREVALEEQLPIVFDPNFRLHRWRTRADAAASADACLPGALLVRANAAEAQLMTGEDDVERAAQSILKAGAQNVVISLGEDGALLRGSFRRDVPGVPARVISTVGAGDAMTATLLARLVLSDFYEPSVAAGLADAVREGAEACERWGAVD